MNYNKYIGLPYKDNGRDVSGLDCWGLVRLFYKQELGIDLPSYADLYTSGSDPLIPEAINTYKDSWELLDSGSPGDVCLFNILGEPAHVGIYIGDNKFLHVREGMDSVIESLTSTQWSKRFSGFYKYTHKCVEVSATPHPLKSTLVHEQAVVGSTLLELTQHIQQKYSISDRLIQKLVISVDGIPVHKDSWASTILQAGQSVTYKTIPSGSTGRTLLMVAVMVAAVYMGQVYGPQLAAAIGTSEQVGAALVTMGVNMAGMALVNAIAPVRMPSQNDPGQARNLNLFTGSSNQINRFGAVPVVLGRMRVTGVHGATPYVDTLTDTSILNMLIVWGFGPLTVEDLRVGTNAITNYYANEFAQNIPAPVTLEGSSEDPQKQIDDFNQLYGGDVEQADISPVELTNNSEDGAPWRYAALSNPCSELAVAFSFPQGMRQIVVSGGNSGDINPAEAIVEIQIRRYLNTTGENGDGEPWGNTVPYSAQTYKTGTATTQTYAYSKSFGKNTITLGNNSVDLYKKYTLCLVPGGSIVLLEGCVSQTRSDPTDVNGLLSLLKNGTYGSLTGTDSAKYIYTPEIPPAYLPIYTFETYNGALVQQTNIGFHLSPVESDFYISHLGNYNHSGLVLSYTEAKENNITYSTTINITPGLVYNTMNDTTNVGEVLDIYSSHQMLTIGGDIQEVAGPDSWSSLLKEYAIWNTSNSLEFTTSAPSVSFPYSGYYYVEASADDEGAVYVDNRPVVLIPNPGYSSTVGNLVYLEAGTYPVRVSAKNTGGGPAGIGFKITYQLNGGLNNMPKPSTILAFGSPGFYYKRRDAFNFVYRIKNLPRGKYEIRVRRTNDDTAEPSAELRNYNKVQLFSLTGYDYVDDSGNIIRPIKELPGTGTNKAYLARTAIRLQSTNKANGNVDGINAVVQTKCKVWNPASGLWEPGKPTSNPAALFRYVLTHPANAYRIEESEVETKLDLVALQAWSEFCDSVTAYKPKLEYNGILTNTQSVLDTLRDICAAGLASPNYVDGKWTVIVDKPRTYTTQYFTPHNSWGFESSKVLPRLPHAFRVAFANRDKAYQPDETIVYNYGYTSANASIFEELSVPGVTNVEQAQFMARWHLAQLKLRPERYTLNTDFEYLVCNRGDVVRVSHDVPRWGTGSGRIKSIQQNTLVLTEPVYLVSGTPYQIRIRFNTGDSAVYAILSVGTSGYYDTVTVSTSLSSAISADNLFMLGEVNKETQELVVLAVEATSNTSARLTLMDYSPEIYSLDLSAELPDFNANISGKSTPIVLQTITEAPIITGVLSADGISEEISSGTYQNTTIVSYANSPNLTNEAKQVQLQVVIGTGEFDGSSPSYSVEKGVGSFTVLGLKTMTIYKFRARYANAIGTVVGPWSDIFYATVIGKTENNYVVPSIVLDLDTTFIVAKVPQNLITPSNFDSYEYRLYKDTGTEDFWDIIPDSTNNIKVINSQNDARFNLLDMPLPRVSTEGITYRVACRTKDRSGNYSTTSALGTIVIKTIQ